MSNDMGNSNQVVIPSIKESDSLSSKGKREQEGILFNTLSCGSRGEEGIRRDLKGWSKCIHSYRKNTCNLAQSVKVAAAGMHCFPYQSEYYMTKIIQLITDGLLILKQ